MGEGERGASTVSWTEEHVRAFLRTYGRAPKRLVVEKLESWWFNVVLRLEADRECLVLRRYGVTPEEEVRWELALLGHLRAHDFPTIAPLARARPGGVMRTEHARRDGAAHETDDCLGEFLGKPAILYPLVEGHNGCAPLVEPTRAIAQTAAAVARLHALTAGLALPYPRIRSGTDSRRTLRELLDYTAQRGVAAQDTALSDMLQRVKRMERVFEARIAPHATRASDLPRGVVHHDAHCANVLFRDDRLVALIDFDDACEGFLLADLAVMIANWAAEWGGRGALDPGKAALVVREYERHRPLTSAERELLPDFVAAFLLADAAAYVRGRLERGADGDTTVNDCNAYRRYVHHAGDPVRLKGLRRMLRRQEW